MKRTICLAMILLLTASCTLKPKASLPTSPPSPLSQQERGSKTNSPLLQGEGLGVRSVRLSGQVSSMNKAMLMFQTPGVIEHIYARPGMFVKKGEVLAELDDRNQRYQAEMAKLQYDQAANQRALVERNYNIEKQLREKDLNAPLQFEASRTQFENASMAEQIAHTAYKIAAKALQDTKLRAPFDCVVTKQMKYVGESSTNMLPPDGPTMFEVYDARASELIFHAPESLLGRIQIGDKIDVTVSALGEKFPAKVVRYAPVISDNTRTFVVVAHLLKPDKRVVAGYFIEGELRLKP